MSTNIYAGSVNITPIENFEDETSLAGKPSDKLYYDDIAKRVKTNDPDGDISLLNGASQTTKSGYIDSGKINNTIGFINKDGDATTFLKKATVTAGKSDVLVNNLCMSAYTDQTGKFCIIFFSFQTQKKGEYQPLITDIKVNGSYIPNNMCGYICPNTIITATAYMAHSIITKNHAIYPVKCNGFSSPAVLPTMYTGYIMGMLS